MLTGRTTDRVVEIRITEHETGTAVLVVVALDEDGREHATEDRGAPEVVRDRARTLAARHDLVPEWQDRSWISAGHRPPAAHYVLR